MLVCYGCPEFATLICKECGRGACSSHSRNHIIGYTEPERYLCSECAIRLEARQNDYEIESSKKLEIINAERQVVQAEQEKLAQERLEQQRLMKEREDYIFNQFVQLKNQLVCKNCNGDGKLKNQWFYREKSSYSERTGYFGEPRLTSAERQEWITNNFHDCKVCKGMGYSEKLDKEIERCIQNLLDKGFTQYEISQSIRKHTSWHDIKKIFTANYHGW